MVAVEDERDAEAGKGGRGTKGLQYPNETKRGGGHEKKNGCKGAW